MNRKDQGLILLGICDSLESLERQCKSFTSLFDYPHAIAELNATGSELKSLTRTLKRIGLRMVEDD